MGSWVYARSARKRGAEKDIHSSTQDSARHFKDKNVSEGMVTTTAKSARVKSSDAQVES